MRCRERMLAVLGCAALVLTTCSPPPFSPRPQMLDRRCRAARRWARSARWAASPTSQMCSRTCRWSCTATRRRWRRTGTRCAPARLPARLPSLPAASAALSVRSPAKPACCPLPPSLPARLQSPLAQAKKLATLKKSFPELLGGFEGTYRKAFGLVQKVGTAGAANGMGAEPLHCLPESALAPAANSPPLLLSLAPLRPLPPCPPRRSRRR